MEMYMTDFSIKDTMNSDDTMKIDVQAIEFGLNMYTSTDQENTNQV